MLCVACQLHQPVHLVQETAPMSASGIRGRAAKKNLAAMPGELRRMQHEVGSRSAAVTHFSCLPHGSNDKPGRGEREGTQCPCFAPKCD